MNTLAEIALELAALRRRVEDFERTLDNKEQEDLTCGAPWKRPWVEIDYVPGFSGNGWAYGKRVTGITQTATGYIRGDRTAQAAIWDKGPPPDPWGENEDWRKISDIIGDFYIP